MKFSLPLLALSFVLRAQLLSAPWGPGTWEFKPGVDPFGAGSLIDLKGLNENVAGEKGFVRLSSDGNDFVLGDGRPVKFWAVGTDLYRKTGEEMERHVRFLAALGVNMIRLHTDLAPKDNAAPMNSIDEKELDGIFRMVAAAKKQGIYLTISPFWPHHKLPAEWGIDGYADREGWGLFFFNDALQAAYKSWIKELYTRKNPYTGIPLSQDPAVAIIQIMNEDSLLFWTSQEIQEPQKNTLRQLFGKWLKIKYGNGAEALPQLLQVWDLTQPQSGGDRAADQTHFFSELQFNFYHDIEKSLRAYGCKQLVNAMNWRSADPVLLSDAERWSYTANEVLAVNKYYTGIHVGKNDGWRIDPGDFMTDESALLKPEALPSSVKQVDGHPFLITESTWVPPLGYQSEGPFLMGAYQALTGLDAYYWFSATDVTWSLDPRLSWTKVNGENPVFKWSCSIPPLLGQFPAAALAYRKGYLRQAEVAVHEERSAEDLWQRRVPLISEEGAFDPNRDQGAFAPASIIKQELDRLAFLVGPVSVDYHGVAAHSSHVPLEKYIDRAGKKVRSLTHEIELDYGKGLCTVAAPAFQGFTGFIAKAGGSLNLPDLSIRSNNDYLTAYFVSMDGRPLASSARILVQVGGVTRLSGWETTATSFKAGDKVVQGLQITHVGSPPWRSQDIDLSFSLRNTGLSKALLLDVDGRLRQKMPLQRQGNFVSLRLPQDSLYLILE
jgi:hypothetical protein